MTNQAVPNLVGTVGLVVLIYGWFQIHVNRSATARLGRFALEEMSLEIRMYPFELFSFPPPMTVPPRSAEAPSVPSIEELRTLTLKTFGKNACNFQLDFARTLLEGKKHVVLQAGCGAGKTLGFWIPLLANPSGFLIVVSPLTLLGDQHADDLRQVNISAVNVDADTIDSMPNIFEDIEHGTYRVVITSPEQLMKHGGGFDRLLRKTHFTSRIIAIIVDEAHCVKLWGSFRPQYRELGRLRHLLPDTVLIAIVSATLPATLRPDVVSVLGITGKDLHTIQLSNDRSNVSLVVRKMKYPANSYKDLYFLVQDTRSDSTDESDAPDGPRVPQHREKFVVFFDNKNDAVAASDYLRSQLPLDQRQRIIWFMSDMSREFKDKGVEDLAAGRLWGICSTDSFGMGIDLKDIELVIQWKVTCDPCILWQRFGGAARNKQLQATALLFVESKDCDQTEEQKARKRKRVDDGGDEARLKPKRAKKKEKPKPMVIGAGENAEELFWKARVAAYHTPIDDKKPEKADMNPVLDDVINADVRGIGCRRRPFQVYFENDKLDGNHACDSVVEGPCPRCSTTLPQLCCDLCHPAKFENKFIVSLEKQKSRPRRSTVEPYKPTEANEVLRKRLDEWRWKMANDLYTKVFTANFGCSTFMPDEELSRICDCAHDSLITSVDTLAKETHWNGSRKYGQHILDIISEVQPTPLPPTPPPTPITATTKAKPREMTCTNCQQTGHSKRAKCCPNYELYVAERSKIGDKKLSQPKNPMQVSFAVNISGDSGPSDLMGEFGQMHL